MKILKIKYNNYGNSKYAKFRIKEYDEEKLIGTLVYFKRNWDNNPELSLNDYVGKIVRYDSHNLIYDIEVDESIINKFSELIDDFEFINDIGLGLGIEVKANADRMNLYSTDYDIKYAFLSINYDNAKSVGYYQLINTSSDTYDKSLSEKFKIIMMNKGRCVFDLTDITYSVEFGNKKEEIINTSILTRTVNLCDLVYIVIPKDFNKEILDNYETMQDSKDEDLPWIISVLREFNIPYKLITEEEIINASI